MSLIKAIKAQLGLSATPANNFVLDASADNGTMKLARGNAGATTQDIMTVGADGKVAFPQSPSVNNGPAFLARKTSTSIIASASNVVVVCSDEIFDTDSAYDTSAGKFQPTVAGYYQVNGTISTNTTGPTTGWTGAYIRKNGVSGVYYPGYVLGVAGAVTGLPVSTVVYLNGTTDYLELVAFITAGSPRVYGDSTSSYQTYWSASLVRAA